MFYGVAVGVGVTVLILLSLRREAGKKASKTVLPPRTPHPVTFPVTNIEEAKARLANLRKANLLFLSYRRFVFPQYQAIERHPLDSVEQSEYMMVLEILAALEKEGELANIYKLNDARQWEIMPKEVSSS